MPQDEETQPILNKASQRGTSTFSVDDPYKSLNGIADDFGDLLAVEEGEDAGGELRALLDPLVVRLSVGLLLFSIAAMVGMPTFLAGLVTHSSDPFVQCFLLPTTAMLFSLAIVLVMRRVSRGTAHEISMYPFFLKRITLFGFLASVGLVLQCFCGVPSRTPAYVQAVSFIVAIPAACIMQFAITHKVYTWRQMMCLLAIAASFVLLMLNLLAHLSYFPGSSLGPVGQTGPEPHLLLGVANDTAQPADSATKRTSAGISTLPLSTTVPTTANPLDDLASVSMRIVWALGFTVGWIFYGAAIVLLDEPIRVQKGNPMVVCLYAHLMTFLWIVFMFFVDLIPKLGWVAHLSDFREHLHHGVKCLVGIGSDCAVIAWRGWLEIFIYAGFYIVQCYLLAVVECPVYAVLVTACAAPVAALTWLCFADTGLTFNWYPSLTPLSTIVFLAFCLVVPATVLYRHYTRRDKQQKFEEL